MSAIKETIKKLAQQLGVLDPFVKAKVSKRLKDSFESDLEKFLKLQSAEEQRFTLSMDELQPMLYDNTTGTGFDRHYVYHPAWAARILKQTMPDYHVDISSALNFSAMVSAFIPVKFYDYRPASLVLDNLSSDRADLSNLFFESNSIKSLSCMHTVEHVGLGRYGDPLDYNGDLKAMSELSRVLAVGGNLLFVVPFGAKAKIMFNAHRIYTKESVIKAFPDLTLKEFTLIPEDENDGGLIKDPSQQIIDKQVYGCGCFWFTK